MRVVMVTKDGEDYSTRAETFVTDVFRQTGHQIEILNPDSPEGKTFCDAYDIMGYPTLIALANDGQVQQVWQDIFPTIDEVGYYAGQY